ncbi:AI-2E family transporter [Parerythrobacter jejuensis]|uniref:AI-2E family transporter n=1 Tax=Parerythrobacter jejuensis TaxID=795812 RepID=A0A845AS97_9SPHN|nr:AI-2E family transporter [Parerythrobacter jejuensis]MXP31825.1 AI-2E family transporter [Parerythrobacter jejuensis]
MSGAKKDDQAKASDDSDVGASPSYIDNPELRQEAYKAAIWVGIVGLAVLSIYIAQSLLVIFGSLVFAAMLDGGARLIYRVVPLPRSVRIFIVVGIGIAFFTWLSMFAGNQIAQQAAEFPAIIESQAENLFLWGQANGLDVEFADLKAITGELVSGVGSVTKALTGLAGGFTSVILIVIIGLYVALEPNLYERGVEWMTPRHNRNGLRITLDRMAYTLRRLMAGRLVGMIFEGVFTYILLAIYGVPMAALLAILTGLLAFVPNIGAIISGILMVLVGFSGGTDMGLYTIFVYFLVQNFDGYIVIPLIAKKTVDLAPALVLGAQLIMGLLFGILGLFLADPLLAMIKVALERRSETNEIKQADAREKRALAEKGNNGA